MAKSCYVLAVFLVKPFSWKFLVGAHLGVGPALWLARGFHVVAATGLVAVGQTAGLGWLYYVGVAAFSLLLIVEHSLISPRDLSRVNVAFATFNGVVSLLLGVLGVLDIILQ